MHPRRMLFDVLEELARERADRPLYTFVDARGREVEELTAAQTLQRCESLAGALRARGLNPGDRVLLAYPPGLEMVVALLGCMRAEVIPVPLPLPIAGGDSLEAVARDCEARMILTSGAFHRTGTCSAVRQALSDRGCDAPWLASDELEPAAPPPGRVVDPDSIALIQYTSGSTRSPRGVCVSHGNLEHQLAHQRRELRADRDSCYVFWLPHYHDFALIAAIFGAAHGNGRTVLTAPTTFLRAPRLWGELMHRYRATHTAAPDSGYRMFIDRTSPKERASWDLSSVRIMASAAEPIRPQTVDDLLRALAPSGLSPESFCPCYGLAEHVVGVTIGGKLRVRVSRRGLEHDGILVAPGRGNDALEVFGCGRPVGDIEVRIVEPISRREVPAGAIGEIWVDSPSKCLGYFGRESESRDLFYAELEGNDRRWLRTGDLGAMVFGELVVTGRLKDLVILHGRNIYPQDVEELVEQSHDAIRPGRVACFACSSDREEKMIIVAELRGGSAAPRDVDAICRSTRARLRSELQLGSFVLALAKRGSILRTTSGKLRRSACRSAWLRNKLDCYAVDSGLGALGRSRVAS